LHPLNINQAALEKTTKKTLTREKEYASIRRLHSLKGTFCESYLFALTARMNGTSRKHLQDY